MAKERTKYELPHSNYLEDSDMSFCLVAVPAPVIVDIDIVRDAIVTYMPGYDKHDFEVLRTFLEWIDNIDGAMCVKEKE